MRFCCCFVLAGTLAWCQSAPLRLTLAEAEKRALSQHPAIEAGQLEAESVAQRIDQAKSARQPFVSANFTAAGADENSRIAAGALNNPVIYSRVASGLTVNQTLLDFGRTSHLIESTRSAAAAAGERVKVTKADVLLAVRRAYYSALRAHRLVQVATATVEARQLIVDQVSQLVKAQLKSTLDLSVVQTSLAEARLLLSSTSNEESAAHAQLAEAMGQQVNEPFELAEEPNPPVVPLALSELKRDALANRPEVLALRRERESQESFAAAEKSLRYPTLSAVGGVGLIPAHVQNLNSNYAAAGLNITLPFLNGGLYKAREAEAELRARATERRIRDLENRIIREVSVAWLDVNNATERVGLTEQFVRQARQALELAQSRYDLGLSSIVELSQAQLVETNAQIQFATAQYDLLLRRSVLDYYAGNLH